MSERHLAWILVRLEEQGALPAGRAGVLTASRQAPEGGSPSYMHALAAFGAFWAVPPLLIALGVMDLLDHGVSRLVIGILLLAGGVALRRSTGQIFLRHLAVVLVLAGDALCVSTTLEADPPVRMLLAGLVQVGLAGAFLALVPDAVVRFLAVWGAVCLLAFWLYDIDHAWDRRAAEPSDLCRWGWQVLLLACAAGAAALARPMAWSGAAPLRYACAVGAVGLASGLSALGTELHHTQAGTSWFSLEWACGLVLTLGLAVFVPRLPAEHPPGLAMRGLLLVAAAVLGVLCPAGVLLGVVLTTLGFAWGDRPLTWLGILGLGCFLIWYYYALNLDLFQKSLLLAGSGMVCLGGANVLRRTLLRRAPA